VGGGPTALQKRLLVGLCAIALMHACTSGHPAPQSDHQPVKLTFWVAAWGGKDLSVLNDIIEGYRVQHPDVTVTLVPGHVDTQEFARAVKAGTGPDLVATYRQEDLGLLCRTGAYTDLQARMRSDHVAESMFVPAARSAVTFEGRLCALPYMADTFGLYYNRTLLSAAGYTSAPKTLSELTAMAAKLTQLNPDGSIKVAGFVPLIDFYQNYVTRFAAVFGAPYLNREYKADLVDPRWGELLTWQKSLVDLYGLDRWKKFIAGLGPEYSLDNGFETGKIAMQLDGEWRTALLQVERPNLDYGTAPFPVADQHRELYGSSMVDVGLLALPRGGRHADQAWQLASYLATEPAPVVTFASQLHNLPATEEGLRSRVLSVGAKFEPFPDAFETPNSSAPPVVAAGSAYLDAISALAHR